VHCECTCNVCVWVYVLCACVHVSICLYVWMDSNETGSWSPPVRVRGEAIACKAGSDFRDPAPSKAKVTAPPSGHSHGLQHTAHLSPHPLPCPPKLSFQALCICFTFFVFLNLCVCLFVVVVVVCVRARGGGGSKKVCMCSSAEYPDYPTAESFAELASTKAPVSIHYYGNCNEKNSKDYTEVRDFFSL
jgi:hypothetical protein